MNTKRIIVDETGGLIIQPIRDSTGRIVSGIQIGDTNYQNIAVLTTANKGDFKRHPILGVGAERYLKSVNRAADLRREIEVQLDAIGYRQADVKVYNDGKLDITVE